MKGCRPLLIPPLSPREIYLSKLLPDRHLTLVKGISFTIIAWDLLSQFLARSPLILSWDFFESYHHLAFMG